MGLRVDLDLNAQVKVSRHHGTRIEEGVLSDADRPTLRRRLPSLAPRRGAAARNAHEPRGRRRRHRPQGGGEEALRLGFRGSPTILLDGQDPFADQDAPVGLACRLYATEGGLQGAPTIDQLRAALAA
jgi:hypothetical protein